MINEVHNTKTADTVKDEQVCVCYDVMKNEIISSIKSGCHSVESVSELTYACQGCGSCRPKIEALIKELA